MSPRNVATLLAITVCAALVFAADVVPNEIMQPGTQPLEVARREAPSRCSTCHGGYNAAVEPFHNWSGGMMSQATRDPLFWATVAISEQDFAGSGDLCLRCHTPPGWINGESTPTEGSDLSSNNVLGVTCDTCHTMVNPDTSEHPGVQNAPFLAHDEGTPPQGYYGGGMYVFNDSGAKFGPYADPAARHPFFQSQFHRDVNFCGTCHDVSNPAVGDLAQNAGTLPTADPVTQSGVLGGPVDDKAAFNNFPFMYGIVERTFSEFKSSAFPTLPVSDYLTLPGELQRGIIADVYNAALVAGTGGDYADGTTRYYSCQSCHMMPVTGKGAAQNDVPVRTDLPMHDMTGGNYWVPDLIQYMDTQDTLLVGGGLRSEDIAALNDGKSRVLTRLTRAAALEVEADSVEVYNLTGHKLISGYPEGRRMWLQIEWYDDADTILRVDGEYGPITVDIDGQPTTVDTILDLEDPHTRIYEAHYGMTGEWAAALVSLGYPSSLPLTYDRVTGTPSFTLGDLAAGDPDAIHESFRFVISNTVVKDNRIPPFGFDAEIARQRNCLPVPESLYLDNGTYRYWDEVPLSPPSGAARADIRLLYQPTSWEYIQFLHLANDGSITFLANEGTNLLDGWLNTGMAAPEVMATATWTAPPGCPNDPEGNLCDTDLDGDCVVNNIDLGQLLAAYLTVTGDAAYSEAADFNDDGAVNNIDLGELLADYLNNCN